MEPLVLKQRAIDWLAMELWGVSLSLSVMVV